MRLKGAEGQPGLSGCRLAEFRVVLPAPARTVLIDSTTLRYWLSEERLGPYDRAARGDQAVSLGLYEWNLAISGAFFESLHILEVALRNAFHYQLTELHRQSGFSGNWYDHPEYLLTSKRCDDIERARRRLRSADKPATGGRIVAELSFGFWRFLTVGRYTDQLWRPALRRAFQTTRPLARPEIADRLTRLHDLRNRIAHHEPIHSRDLARDWQDILYIAEALSPDVRNWLVRTTRVPAILAGRPHRIGSRTDELR